MVHPTALNLPSFDGPVLTTDGSGVDIGGYLGDLAERLREARPLFSIGELEAPTDSMLGQIRAIRVDGSGDIFALDRSHNFVRHFSSTGRPKSVIGGKGQGIGEFLSPKSIVLFGEALFVADAYGVVIEFQESPSGWGEVDRNRFPFEVQEMCATRNLIAMKTMKEEEVGGIEIFERSGGALSLVRAIGSWYRDDDPFVRWNLAGGQIGCADASDIVIEMLDMVPVLRAYKGSTGELLWELVLGSYTALKTVRTPRALDRYMKVVEFDHTSSMIDVNGVFVIQTMHQTPEAIALGRFAYLDTYLVEIATGRGVYLGNELPRIMAIKGDRIYAYADMPYPKISVLTF